MEQQCARRFWLVPALLAVAVIVLFRPVIWPPEAGQVLDGSDMRGMFYPLQEYIRQTLIDGDLPLWNPHHAIGVPVVGNPHSALLYPGSWLVWLIGIQRGIGLLLVLHMWFGAWGMARLMRGFGTTHSASLLAGILFAMSGWVGARFCVGHYNLLLVYAWIPWAMLAYRYALNHSGWAAVLPGIGVIGAAVLAGYTPLLIHMGWTLLAVGIWHVVHDPQPRQAVRFAAFRLAVIGVGAGILGAVTLLPSAELARYTTRELGDLAFANSVALPPAQLLSALALPDLFGSPATPPSYYWGTDFYEEFTAYAGLLPLLAIPLALRFKRREAFFFLGLIALGLVLSLGTGGTLTALLVRWVPGYSLFRVPARALLLVVMGLAGLTALLVTALQTSTPNERHSALQPALRLWIPAAVAVLFTLAIFFSGWYASASHVEPMPHRAMQVAGVLAKAAVILCGVWGVLWLWAKLDPTPAHTRWAAGLMAALIVLDAWQVVIPIVTVSRVDESAEWTWARTNIPTDARLLAPAAKPFNRASITGHYHVLSYETLPLKTFDELQQLGGISDPATPINRLLGVNYFLSSTPYDNPDFELIGIVYGSEPDSYAYARRDPFPRAWFAQQVVVEPNDQAVRDQLANPNTDAQAVIYVDRALDCAGGEGTATITRQGTNDLTITTSGDGGVLVLSDQYYPGWQAEVDGESVDIVRADTAFRAVCVPAGEHTVTFSYHPTSFYAGVIVTVVGWIIWLVLGLIAWRRANGETKTLPHDFGRGNS